MRPTIHGALLLGARVYATVVLGAAA
jgi:hypothetical protein